MRLEMNRTNETVLNSPRSEWQERYNDFNHDWLKNKYMQALGKIINVIDGRSIDRHFLEASLKQTLQEWEPRPMELESLLDDVENDMSPRRLFFYPPHSRCAYPTKSWLPELVDALWLSRLPIKACKTAVRLKAEKTDEAYTRLISALPDSKEPMTVSMLRPLRPQFVVLRECCQELADALTKLSREVL